MTNDLTTLSGALLEMRDELIYQLGQKGVTASYSSTDGLLGLIGRISDIQQGGGSCYHIEFSESSYTAVGGSATLEIYLQENYAPKSGATVTVTGSDSSSYTGITNSNGIAQVTVTGISGTVTFTCTYSNVSDTCSVTGSTYLFYDECTSADGLSNYGSLHKLKVANVAGTLSYDSNMNAYKITTTTANADGLSDFPIPTLDNKNNYYIEAEFYTTDTSTGGQVGLVVYPTNDTGGNGVMWRDIAQINRCGVLPFSNYNYGTEAGNAQKSALPVANNWIRVRLEVNGTSVKGIWLKTDGTEVYSYTYTVPYTSGAMRVGLAAMLKSTTKPYYVRNIKAEAL